MGGTGDHTFSGQGLNYRGTGFTYNYAVTIVKPGMNFAGFNTGFSTSKNNCLCSCLTHSFEKHVFPITDSFFINTFTSS
jgi:hypothetical protein